MCKDASYPFGPTDTESVILSVIAGSSDMIFSDAMVFSATRLAQQGLPAPVVIFIQQRLPVVENIPILKKTEERK